MKKERGKLQSTDVGVILFIITLADWAILAIIALADWFAPEGLAWITNPTAFLLEKPTMWWIAIPPLCAAFLFVALPWVNRWIRKAKHKRR